MSNAHHPNDGGIKHGADDVHDIHEGPIKTPKQLIAAVVAGFLVPIVLAIMLANFVSSGQRPAAGSQTLEADAVARRIQPVGRVDVKDPTDVTAMKSGEQVYAAQCVTCHDSGAAGAPKIGDATAWAPRLKTGFEMLLQSSLKGKGSMGAQGGGDFTDFEIARAVTYLANKGGGKYDEPKFMVAAASSAPAIGAAPAAPVTAVAAAAMPAPTAAVVAAVVAAAPVATKADAAPALYTQICAACHIAGVANAPKLGDKAAWAPRLAGGVEGLTASVIAGKGVMPARGGAATATDAEIKGAVTYMVGTVK